MAPATTVPAFSTDDFPPLSALSIKEMPRLKVVASATTSIAEPVQTSPFLWLPLEIRNEIYRHLLVHDQRIDITVPHKKRGVIPNRFKKHVPDLKNVSILQVCQQTEREAMEFMYSSNQFYSKNSDTISKLTVLLGEMGTSCIQYLDLETHFLMKVHNRYVWSSSLDFIVKHLPSLKNFCLRTDFAVNATPLVETPGADRFGQERRALLKFGAFITHRHPVLRRLIWPSDSGPSHEPGEWRVYARVELLAADRRRKWDTTERYENAGDQEEKTFEDLLLDSTAIRRVAWLDLDTKPVANFAIDKDLRSSETEETNNFFNLVHQFGYRTTKELRQQDANHLPSIDKMIRDAETSTRQAGRGRGQRGRGQSGDRGTWPGGGRRGMDGVDIRGGQDGQRGARQGKFRRGWGPLEGSRQGRGGYY